MCIGEALLYLSMFSTYVILPAGLPDMKVRTTHRMVTDTFNSIIKLGAGLKKKKKKKGKKVRGNLICGSM